MSLKFNQSYCSWKTCSIVNNASFFTLKNYTCPQKSFIVLNQCVYKYINVGKFKQFLKTSRLITWEISKHIITVWLQIRAPKQTDDSKIDKKSVFVISQSPFLSFSNRKQITILTKCVCYHTCTLIYAKEDTKYFPSCTASNGIFYTGHVGR